MNAQNNAYSLQQNKKAYGHSLKFLANISEPPRVSPSLSVNNKDSMVNKTAIS